MKGRYKKKEVINKKSDDIIINLKKEESDFKEKETFNFIYLEENNSKEENEYSLNNIEKISFKEELDFLKQNEYVNIIDIDSFLSFIKKKKSYNKHLILNNKVKVFLEYKDMDIIKYIDDNKFDFSIELIKVGSAFSFYLK